MIKRLLLLAITFTIIVSIPLYADNDPSMSEIKISFLESNPLKPFQNIVHGERVFSIWLSKESKPPYYTPPNNSEKLLSFAYSPTEKLRIKRNKADGSFNISTPFSDRWEVFGEASKKLWKSSPNYRMMGGVQVNW